MDGFMSKLVKVNLSQTPPIRIVSPATAKVLSNAPLHTTTSSEDIRHLVFDSSGSGLEYVEGQSLGILAPGVDEKGKPHKLRLYSVASAPKGDNGSSQTASLCVKRVVFQDEETGKEVRGVASNYLCDLQKGDEVLFTGPVGKALLLPKDTSTDLLLFAVGTGIAPFRAFLNRIFFELEGWQGKIYLFFGARTKKEALYLNEANSELMAFQKKGVTIYTAFSREEKTKNGERMYIQHRLAEEIDPIWEIMKKENFSVYLCGLKGMEQGIRDVFSKKAAQHGIDWEEKRKEYKKEGRWNVEVY